jgi:hypothetical protein
MSTKSRRKKLPSLLDAESRGGDIAEGGLSFQESILLAQLPMCLTHDGFTSLIREAMGDFECKFYVPGHGYQIEFVEVKSNQLSAGEFWAEIDRFLALAATGERYRRFTLVTAGYAAGLAPVINQLRRLQDPREFYGADSSVMTRSFQEFEQTVRQLRRSRNDAEFLVSMVHIETRAPEMVGLQEAAFKQSFSDAFPEHTDLSVANMHELYLGLAQFIRSRRNQPMGRRELEELIETKIAPTKPVRLRPITIHTQAAASACHATSLCFAWDEFFGDVRRSFPPPDRWKKGLMKPLRETQEWIVQNRKTRRIRLTGNRRLSASLAIGAVFSAVAGYSIEFETRNGESWATDDHATAASPSYPLQIDMPSEVGERLVVSVGILRNILGDVSTYQRNSPLCDLPVLHIYGNQPLESAQHANLAVREIKSAITKALAVTKCRQIDLFFAGPAAAALFLGHRLNAVGPVQCYEWAGTGQYVPTCLLFDDQEPVPRAVRPMAK